MLVRLPNGFIDGVDHFCVAEVDELRGKQQNYLADKELVVGNLGHVPKILAEVVKSIQTAEGVVWKGPMSEVIEKLPFGDLETLLVKIRENTYGPRFYFEAYCEHCGHHHKDLKLELDKLEITQFPKEQMLDNASRTFTLPKAQVEVELKPYYLKDMFSMIKIGKEGQHKLITSVIALSTKRIGDKTNVTPEDIDGISASDLAFMKDKLEEIKLEGTIDTEIITDCVSCKQEFKTKLDVISPDFFVHTRGSTSSTT